MLLQNERFIRSGCGNSYRPAVCVFAPEQSARNVVNQLRKRRTDLSFSGATASISLQRAHSRAATARIADLANATDLAP